MKATTTILRWVIHPLVPAALFAIYLGLAVVSPSQWQTVLLGYAVVLSAHRWEARGGLLAAGAAGASLCFWLWRLEGQALITDGRILPGYLWAWLALVVLGLTVGRITTQTRAVAKVNAELRSAQQRLAALHTVAVSLSTTLDVDRLIGNILEQLETLWGYHYGAVLLLDDQSGELVIAGARGYARGKGERLPAGQGICGAVLRGGQPICVGEVTNDPRYVAGVEGSRSELAVPLIWEGRAIGVLNVESSLPDAFTDDDVTLLTTVAEHAALALGNARLHQQARHLAVTDPHTGLFNFRHLQEQVAANVRDAQISGRPFSMLMLDIDLFKRINDTYGHPTGDAVLYQVAEHLQATVRQGDLCYRYGGEEFAVTLPGAPQVIAVRVAERIRERIAAHLYTNHLGRRLEIPVTVSIGIATYPRHGMTAVDLMLAADKALYFAKSSGRDRIVDGPPSPESELA